MIWEVGGESELFATPPAPATAPGMFAVPRAFIKLARTVIQHRDPERFSLLYAFLCRLRERPRAMEDGADPLLRRLEVMARSVRRGDNAGEAWAAVREEAMGCTRCPLFRDATQTVFGEGPLDARIMFVGEQPGDQEDLQGRPFVGPAGQLFDRAMAEAGVDRARTYVTNAVKHFKFERRGKRRLHQKPDGGEIQACRWWLERERQIIRPAVTVALGVTAARSLFGKVVTISKMRGEPHQVPDGGETWVTVHPSFLLRVRDNKEEEYARFVEDLMAIGKRAKALAD